MLVFWLLPQIWGPEGRVIQCWNIQEKGKRLSRRQEKGIRFESRVEET
jgi:hypothetical protein